MCLSASTPASSPYLNGIRTLARKKQKKSPVERRIAVYRERNRNLRAMGFDSYADYLRSDLWASIRSRVLAPGTKCLVCLDVATQAHHEAYRKCDLEGRDLRRIHPLCSGCHRRIEFRDRDGEKLNPAQARAKMRQAITLRIKKENSSL